MIMRWFFLPDSTKICRTNLHVHVKQLINTQSESYKLCTCKKSFPLIWQNCPNICDFTVFTSQHLFSQLVTSMSAVFYSCSLGSFCPCGLVSLFQRFLSFLFRTTARQASVASMWTGFLPRYFQFCIFHSNTCPPLFRLLK